ncbi:hypothetical protein AMECASPLE_032845 [Ameca splendens]|uniref:Uncharacterized protein n=1 Tax=Ameca splendens TaxID=208324 RepID=A0ABV0YTP3_9TELE
MMVHAFGHIPNYVEIKAPTVCSLDISYTVIERPNVRIVGKERQMLVRAVEGKEDEKIREMAPIMETRMDSSSQTLISSREDEGGGGAKVEESRGEMVIILDTSGDLSFCRV